MRRWPPRAAAAAWPAGGGGAASSSPASLGKRRRSDPGEAAATPPRRSGYVRKDGGRTELLDGASWVAFHPRIAAAEGAFQKLIKEVEWMQRDVVMFGKPVAQPRLVQYMADEAALAYKYAGCDLTPVPWHPVVTKAREVAERAAGVAPGFFNSALLNLYRTGNDANGWHADDEPLYGENPTIASVTFGSPRDFDIKRRPNGPEEKLRYVLGDGDVLVMGGAMQRNYVHTIPKRAKVDGERINLTFRRIVNSQKGLRGAM